MNRTPCCPNCLDSVRDLGALDTHLKFYCTALRREGSITEPVWDRRSIDRPTDEEFWGIDADVVVPA